MDTTPEIQPGITEIRGYVAGVVSTFASSHDSSELSGSQAVAIDPACEADDDADSRMWR